MIGYVNIEEQVDYDFTRVRRRAFVHRMRARIFGDPASTSMRSFEDVSNELGAFNRFRLGKRVVAVEKIVGSVGRFGGLRPDLPADPWQPAGEVEARRPRLPQGTGSTTRFALQGGRCLFRGGRQPPRKRGVLPGRRVDRRRSDGPTQRYVRGPDTGVWHGTDGGATGSGSAARRGVSGSDDGPREKGALW